MINIERLSFCYGEKQVLADFSLSLARGEILALMGPSGCGKSTLLNLIAGLRKPTGGKIDCNAAKIAYVFQEPRLFPWLTVRENLRAVLPKGTPDSVITEALESVQLTGAAELYPDALSGGMKSRVALARALAYGGDLLLLDEPFSALGETQRNELAAHLRASCKARGLSVILVTHQQSDADLLADRTLLLKEANQ